MKAPALPFASASHFCYLFFLCSPFVLFPLFFTRVKTKGKISNTGFASGKQKVKS